jgi:phosphate transport system permease protein
LNSTLDLLAGIPSVIYGFWGLMVLVPMVRQVEVSLGVVPHGVGIFSASIILALMIVPYSASISREVISLVPHDLKEAALSLGATKFEVITKVILPYARSGIFAGILMSFGRAVSETMAVTMLIGNANKLPSSIFSPANTLASVIANEFAEASEALYLSSLIELALILFFVTAIFSFVGRLIIKKLMVNM